MINRILCVSIKLVEVPVFIDQITLVWTTRLYKKKKLGIFQLLISNYWTNLAGIGFFTSCFV